ncbi:putative nuclease HARBI1 [Temnothorax nylanderi]|uniref:putative nuclease HARBI1 n=1 Tax=Temnothorax nylanderi TaxID=102681 RepID=UPI003A8704DD
MRNNAIPPVIQLMVALRFYATGSFFMTVGDFCGISEVSAHSIVHRVSPAIAALRNQFIKLPTSPEEICRNQQEFYQTAKFIRVVGCMDCTHVKIQSYGGETSELYRNRKEFFSINVQVIINARLEIIDIVARWPGSTHDSTIFNHPRIKTLFELGTFGDGLLLGDSGYPNLPYLMTSVLNPTTPAQHLYNEAQIHQKMTSKNVKPTKRKLEDDKTLDEAKTELAGILKADIEEKRNYEIEILKAKLEKEKLKIDLLKIVKNICKEQSDITFKL